jgi:hypothetical protein
MRERTFSNLMQSGVSEPQARARTTDQVSRFTTRLRTSRSETIARTEILRSTNAGRYLGFQQAVESGYADPKSMKKWRTGGTALSGRMTCERCRPMEGEVVAWDDVFTNGIDFPPAHPNCRCTFTVLPPTSRRLADPTKVNPADNYNPPLPATVGMPVSQAPKIPVVPSTYDAKPDVSDKNLDPAFLAGQSKKCIDNFRNRDYWLSRGCSDVATMADHLGYHAKPAVVSQTQLDDLIENAGHIELFRGVQPSSGGITAGAIAEHLRTGEFHYIGSGIFGHGTYTSTRNQTALAYAGVNGSNLPTLSAKKTTGQVGQGYVIRMGLRPDAKVANYETLQTDFGMFHKKMTQTIMQENLGNDAYAAFSDLSAYAMTRGYDAIHVEGSMQGESFYVILNRSAVVVQQHE